MVVLKVARIVVLSLSVSLLAGLAGCGALAPSGGGGAKDLPSSGDGTYVDLPSESARLLVDPVASLEEPMLLTDGEALTIYYVRRDALPSLRLRRARYTSFDDRAPRIDAPLDGDPDGVSAPAVLAPWHAGEPWLLCYARAGAIECAAGDGERFTAPAAPTLIADGPNEGDALGSPALLRLGDQPPRIGLVYRGGIERSPGLFVADAALPRAPGDPLVDLHRSDARAPVLSPGAAPWLAAIGRTTARTARTAADRLRYDLFITGRSLPTPSSATGVDVIGVAASFDGARFTAAPAPFFAAQPPGRASPTASAWRGGSLLLYTTIAGRYSIIEGARSP